MDNLMTLPQQPDMTTLLAYLRDEAERHRDTALLLEAMYRDQMLAADTEPPSAPGY